MSDKFWNSPVYQIIQAMKATGNQTGVIQRWKDSVERWASVNNSPEAQAVKAWLPVWQVRPFYTAGELAPLYPALAIAVGAVNHVLPQMSAKRLAYLLDFGGLPKLSQYGRDPSTYQNPLTGYWNQYYIVERVHYWSRRGVFQEDFEQEFARGTA